jgi:hypothetical protein
MEEVRLPTSGSLKSINGKFTLKVQNDGRVTVLDENNERFWTSVNNTNYKPSNPFLVMQEDGRLISYSTVPTKASQNQLFNHWDSETVGLGNSPYFVFLQDNGSLQILDTGREVIWTSETNVLQQDQRLPQNEYRQAKNGEFRFNLQSSANIVVFDRGGSTEWVSDVGGNSEGPYYLVLEGDGYLTAYDERDIPVWKIEAAVGRGVAPYSLYIQNDGSLEVIDSEMNVLWNNKLDTDRDAVRTL